MAAEQTTRTPLRSARRYALVTGGGSGIGRAICQQLASSGWVVAVADLDLPAAEATLASLPSPADDHLAVELDVASAAAWTQQIAMLQTEWPRIDLLVNNAGALAGGELAATPEEEIRRLVEVNLMGAIHGCRATIPWLVESATRDSPLDRQSPRSGVINTASIFAALAPPGFATYSATKAAIVALSESLRGELAPHGLNMTVTLPGVTKTGLFERAYFPSAAFRQTANRYVQDARLAPADVAQQTLQAAASGKLYAVIGRRARWYARLKRWLPTLVTRRVAKQSHDELG